ncbi:MAG TPA: adenylyl-sulfate kinase [Actinomycetota bacterium]|nr:adenylyl-sulfate kinase [Actinomycetota bacterium]
MGRVAGRAILITGAYGSGKSTVAAEAATVLERAGRPYALLDLDYLMWADPPDVDVHDDPALLLANLEAVVRNDRRVGIEEFVLAGHVRADVVGAIRSTLGVPLAVVALDVPWAEIVRRLTTGATTARAEDLREAERQVASSSASDADFVVRNDRPASETADEILRLAGWHDSG